MRKGFGLITAIIFIVIIAILGTYALLVTTQGVEESNDAYLKTQADVLNNSALDYALYKVRNSNTCLDLEYVYYKKGPSGNTIKFSNSPEKDCLFATTIKYTYYNSDVCPNPNITAKTYMTNHKMVIKAEAVTTTCDFLDGWNSNKTNAKTNKISTYGYKIIGK